MGWVKCDGWVGKSELDEVGWVRWDGWIGINELSGLDGLGEGVGGLGEVG